MAMHIKEQTALTALRDELRKVFEPFGARVEQFDVQLAGRMLRWRSRTPDYPSHHVGGAFEEWNVTGRANKQHEIVIVIVRDEDLLEERNERRHSELFEARWIPQRLSPAKIAQILDALGIALADPVITVLPAASIWSSRCSSRR